MDVKLAPVNCVIWKVAVVLNPPKLMASPSITIEYFGVELWIVVCVAYNDSSWVWYWDSSSISETRRRQCWGQKNFSVCNIRIFHRIVGLCWWGLNINLGNGVMSDKANTCVDALQVSTDNIKPVLRQQITRVIHGWMHFIWSVFVLKDTPWELCPNVADRQQSWFWLFLPFNFWEKIALSRNPEPTSGQHDPFFKKQQDFQ